MGSIEKMVCHAIAIAEDDSHGYSQAVRWGPDYDCSSLMYISAEIGGYSVPTWGTRYTGTMVEHFRNAGFTVIPWSEVGISGCRRGDILLNVADHTEMCIGGGKLVGAHSSETGGIYGQIGDQTGNEISIVPIYNYPWDYVLRPPADEVRPKQVPGKTLNSSYLRYRVHVQDLGWCDWVRDGQCAGTTGFAKRWEALNINPPEGLVLRVRVHIQNLGWKTYENIRHGNSIVIGTTGQSLRIEDIIVESVENVTNKTLSFQVHQQDTGWKAWTLDGYSSGSDGLGMRLEAIKMKLV